MSESKPEQRESVLADQREIQRLEDLYAAQKVRIAQLVAILRECPDGPKSPEPGADLEFDAWIRDYWSPWTTRAASVLHEARTP